MSTHDTDAETPVPTMVQRTVQRLHLAVTKELKGKTGVHVHVTACETASPNAWEITLSLGDDDTPVDRMDRLVQVMYRRSRRSGQWRQRRPEVYLAGERDEKFEGDAAEAIRRLVHKPSPQPDGRPAQGAPAAGKGRSSEDVRRSSVIRN